MGGFCWVTGIIKTWLWFSIRSRSGLSPASSQTFRCFHLNHSTIPSVCSRSLSFWKVILYSSLNFLEDETSFLWTCLTSWFLHFWTLKSNFWVCKVSLWTQNLCFGLFIRPSANDINGVLIYIYSPDIRTLTGPTCVEPALPQLACKNKGTKLKGKTQNKQNPHIWSER